MHYLYEFRIDGWVEWSERKPGRTRWEQGRMMVEKNVILLLRWSESNTKNVINFNPIHRHHHVHVRHLYDSWIVYSAATTLHSFFALLTEWQQLPVRLDSCCWLTDCLLSVFTQQEMLQLPSRAVYRKLSIKLKLIFWFSNAFLVKYVYLLWCWFSGRLWHFLKTNWLRAIN